MQRSRQSGSIIQKMREGDPIPTGSKPPPMVLSYGTEPKARAVARRLWWAMLLLAAVLIAAFVLLFNLPLEIDRRLGYGVAGTPAAPVDFGNPADFRLSITGSGNFDYCVQAVLYLGLFLLTQWLFLMPRGAWRFRLALDGRPLKRASVAAAFVAMLLSAGMLAVLLEVPFPRAHEAWDSNGHPSLWLRWTVHERPRGEGYQGFWWFFMVMLIMWIIWAWVFWRYMKSVDRHTGATKVFRGLVAGSVLELLVAGPAHAYLGRDDDCYCTRGSYTALVFGVTALLWLFGPGVFLLFLREKRRMERWSASETEIQNPNDQSMTKPQ